MSCKLRSTTTTATTTTTSTATLGGYEGSTSGGGTSICGGTSLRVGIERQASGGSARESVYEETEPGSDVEQGREHIERRESKDKRGSVKLEEEADESPGAEDDEGVGEREIDGSLKPRLSQAKRQWSIQAVKGKVTTSCLWNACKALTIGTILIFIGAGMATIGYYAEEENLRRQQNLSDSEIESGVSSGTVPNHVIVNHTSPYWRPPQIVGSNTPRVRGPRPPSTTDHNSVMITNSSTGGPKATSSFSASSSFGLNKLSYVGPIVMGVGGFVIVAACVMTFEARDSAAKIVPARFRKSFPERPQRMDDPNVRHSSAQTKWETLGVYGNELVRFHHEKELSRRAMTSAFIRFSKTIQSSLDSSTEYYEFRGGHRGSLVKCPSAPSLIREFHQGERRFEREPPRILRVSAFPKPIPRRRLSSQVYPRQTMSVDNPAVKEVYSAAYPQFIGGKGDEEMELGASATGVHRVGSDASLALDLHLPRCAVTLTVRDSSRSPSGQTEQDEPSAASPGTPVTPVIDPLSDTISTEEIPGPSGIKVHQVITSKIDKQTSTSDYLSSLGWSKDTWDPKDAAFLSSRSTAGGSFRESKKAKSRKVKRSETIDTATSTHKKAHGKSHHQRSRAGSIKSASDAKKQAPVRSETARRHQLLRQPKIENPEVHDDCEKGGHAV